MPKTRRWIDKKKSVTFKLVSRSQKDLLIADDNAPQHVLLEIHPKSKKREKNDLKKKLNLPSFLFASEVEEDEGLLNKAILPVGPQPDWDADIVAAMDEDFDFDNPNNIIDDDFVTQAGGVFGVEDEKEDFENREVPSDFGSDNEGGKFGNEETRSIFTQYSLSSSVLPRNEGLTQIDEQFETMFEKEYGNDMNIGMLYDEIEEDLNPNTCLVIQQLIKRKEEEKKFQVELNKDVIVNYVDSDDEMTRIEITQDSGKNQTDRYDCESIISTYSNLYNHPKLICEERRKQKCLFDNNGVVILNHSELTKKNLKLHNAFSDSIKDADQKSHLSRCSKISELSYRPKNETLKEKKARKSALKAYQRERKIEKKANKLAFKLESERYQKELLNLQNNLSGIKLF